MMRERSGLHYLPNFPSAGCDARVFAQPLMQSLPRLSVRVRSAFGAYLMARVCCEGTRANPAMWPRGMFLQTE